MRKHIVVVILLCLGFFLTPALSYACARKTNTTEHKTYSKDNSANADKKDCCKTGSCKKDNKHKGCNGKCEHSSCRCSTSFTSLTLPVQVAVKAASPFAETKKQKFNFKQAYYSSGYAFIWQPPKIS